MVSLTGRGRPAIVASSTMAAQSRKHNRRKAHVPSETDLPRPIRTAGPVLSAGLALVLATLMLAGRLPGHDASLQQALAASMDRGARLYCDLWCPFLPGSVLTHRLVMVFLHPSSGVIWLMDGVAAAGSSVLVYLLARRLAGSSIVALISGLSYPLLYYCTDRQIPGQPQTWATLFCLAGLYILTLPVRRAILLRAFACGTLCGLAVLQQAAAALFLAVAAACCLQQFGRSREGTAAAGMLALGAALPLALTAAWLQTTGAMAKMLEQAPLWSVVRLNHQSLLTLQIWAGERLGLALPGATGALAGLYSLARSRYGKVSALIALWAVLAAGQVALQGPELAPQNWTPFLPAWCILGACGIETLLRRSASGFWRSLGWLALAAGIAVSVNRAAIREEQAHAEKAPEGLTQATALARSLTDKQERILVWDWAPQIYVLAGRHPAGGMLSCEPLVSGNGAEAERFFWESFRKSPARVIVIRRAQIGEENGRRDSLATRIPPRWDALEDLLDQHYVLVDKTGGYEVFSAL